MTIKVPFEILQIEEDGYHLLVRALINNEQINLLIDTGASKTVFDYNKIAGIIDTKKLKQNSKLSVGLGSDKIKSYSIVLKQINIGNFQLNNYKTALMDLSSVNKSYKKMKLPEINGILGGDFLMQTKAIINYKEKILELIE